jgi:hypothetical protein
VKRRRPLEHISDTQRDPQVRDALQRNLLGQANQSLVQMICRNRMLAEQARLLGREIIADDTAELPRPSSLPGDPKRLRGIPAIGGRGSIGGAINGTQPERELLARERRRQRVGGG